MMIVLTKGYTNKEYADIAIQANAEGKVLTILENGDVDMSAIVFTLEELQTKLIAKFTNLVQNYLDAKAKERNYENILSLCTYATSANPTFAKEGQAGVVWRDSVWEKCYAILAEVKAGTRATPTAEEVLAELPVFTWGD